MIKKFENFNDNDPYDEEIWEEDLSEILDNLLVVLVRRGWSFAEEDDRYYKMAPPSNLGFPENPPKNNNGLPWRPYRLYVPKNVEKNDFMEIINKVIDILIGIYGDERENYIK